ncbi:GRM7 isoform 9 [Pan troglodytes]|uniref:GRM7 isoform 9 n=1 Tax=Pan troglodytes TaxID=9598 RepID=A0A2J8M0P5_PANTR|nr:GRM7 isoform 9 [Pan troglodytes]
MAPELHWGDALLSCLTFPILNVLQKSPRLVMHQRHPS